MIGSVGYPSAEAGMRTAGTFLLMALVFAPAAVRAADLAPMKPHASANIVEAAVNCGHDAHYIRGYRDKHGHYVKGHCVRNKHH
jgi:hypothetical protein